MSKEIKCNKCNQNLVAPEISEGINELTWSWYDINSKQFNSDITGEREIYKFSTCLCENCYKAEKDKYLGKEEYSITKNTRYWKRTYQQKPVELKPGQSYMPGMSSSDPGHTTSEIIQSQRRWTLITDEWFENFKKHYKLKSITVKKGVGIVFIDENGKSLGQYGNITSMQHAFRYYLDGGCYLDREDGSWADVLSKYLESKGKGSSTTPPPTHILPTKSLNWSLR